MSSKDIKSNIEERVAAALEAVASEVLDELVESMAFGFGEALGRMEKAGVRVPTSERCAKLVAQGRLSAEIRSRARASSSSASNDR